MGKRRASAQVKVNQPISLPSDGQGAIEPSPVEGGHGGGSPSPPLFASPPAAPPLPHYDADLRELSVNGSVILRLPVHGHNLAAILNSLQISGWKPRVAKPLNGRPDGNEPSRLADAVYSLNQRQSHVDFHADGGAVRWNWRQKTKTAHHSSHNGKPKPPSRRNGRRVRQEDRENVD